jgi:hypothetical protein
VRSRRSPAADRCDLANSEFAVISIHASRTNCRDPSIFRFSNAATKLKPGYSRARVKIDSPTALRHCSILFACLTFTKCRASCRYWRLISPRQCCCHRHDLQLLDGPPSAVNTADSFQIMEVDRVPKARQRIRAGHLVIVKINPPWLDPTPSGEEPNDPGRRWCIKRRGVIVSRLLG